MGVLDHLSNMLNCSGGRSKLKKHKQLQSVDIKVKIDCEGCERKVRRSVEGMKGVTSVQVWPHQNKLSVTGYVNPDKVVARVAHRTGKRAELWPYVPYDEVQHPYASGIYDKKAPSGYVRYPGARVAFMARTLIGPPPPKFVTPQLSATKTLQHVQLCNGTVEG